ncbi:MAG: RidA family protein [Alphaproteobacteria bacterium]|jgi:enamine deaminase RidA (YjgF/YER057c/UK114 family)|nr:RidA family protein [Alphaproteobacteria bacterium]
MLAKHNPDTVAAPLSDYSHGVEAPAGARWLYISGQVAIAPDGSIPDSIEGQATQVFENILAVLEAANMGAEDLVRINTYLVNAGYMGGFRAVRDKYVGQFAPASTMIMIGALATPDLLIEIEAVAAKVD